MRKIRIFVLLIILILITLVFVSSESSSLISLKKGKNYVGLNLSELIYVETLVDLNPRIEAVSYSDNNLTVGYVNIFGGIGENFILEEREYEIIVSKDIDLILSDRK